jgi:hypothetical protein
MSSRAPLDEMLRTMQSTPPPNASVPCLSTLCLGAARFSIMVVLPKRRLLRRSN